MTPRQIYNASEKARETARRYANSPKGRATRKARNRRARANDPEKFRAKQRKFVANHPDTPAKAKAKGLRRKYGIGIVQWLAMFHFQGACCSLCKTTETGSRGWATDHDHETGRVRGILCHRCNLCLGWLGDTRTIVDVRLNAMRAYLSEPGASPRWRDGGKKRAGPDDRLVCWEPG